MAATACIPLCDTRQHSRKEDHMGALLWQSLSDCLLRTSIECPNASMEIQNASFASEYAVCTQTVVYV